MNKGVVSKKGVDYRKALLKAVGDTHPVKRKIHMQAHHLISEEGIAKSEIGETLINRGYNVNELNNLVFLPSTPAGACHLEVQLHRGDHTHECEEDFSDDDHPLTYHHVVKGMVKAVEQQIDDCDDADFKKAQQLLDEISKDILLLISEFKLPLTKVFKAFRPGNKIGCSNSVDVNEHKAKNEICKHSRNHEGISNPMYVTSKSRPSINMGKVNYELKVGQ